MSQGWSPNVMDSLWIWRVAVHSNGLLNRALAGPSKLVLAWRGILQNVRGAHQRASWPHCHSLLSTESVFPKVLTAGSLGLEWICPSARILIVSVLIWVLKDKFLPRSLVFNIYTRYSYLFMEINIDYLFSSPSAGMALCLVAGRVCVLCSTGVSVPCVWMDGCERWEREWAWKEKGCRKLLFLALPPVAGS